MSMERDGELERQVSYSFQISWRPVKSIADEMINVFAVSNEKISGYWRRRRKVGERETPSRLQRKKKRSDSQGKYDSRRVAATDSLRPSDTRLTNRMCLGPICLLSRCQFICYTYNPLSRRHMLEPLRNVRSLLSSSILIHHSANEVFIRLSTSLCYINTYENFHHLSVPWIFLLISTFITE
jgi:hypothetical protein